MFISSPPHLFLLFVNLYVCTSISSLPCRPLPLNLHLPPLLILAGPLSLCLILSFGRITNKPNKDIEAFGSERFLRCGAPLRVALISKYCTACKNVELAYQVDTILKNYTLQGVLVLARRGCFLTVVRCHACRNRHF
jgi:hypothetical protein